MDIRGRSYGLRAPGVSSGQGECPPTDAGAGHTVHDTGDRIRPFARWSARGGANRHAYDPQSTSGRMQPLKLNRVQFVPARLPVMEQVDVEHSRWGN